MKIVFLGTNGWYSNQTGNTPCILIDSIEGYIIFDAGNGFYKIDQYIKEEKPIFLFISHFHLDHVEGLHTLSKFDFPQGIDVYVGRDRKKDFETLVNPPYTKGFLPRIDNLGNLKTEVRLHELLDGIHNIPFQVTIIEQFHGFRDHGFRVELEGKIIAYSGDCGISEASYKLAQNADILIHECSYFRAQPVAKIWGHVTPEEAAKLSKVSGVKKLILTHFGPTQYPTLESRADAKKRAKKIFPQTEAAKDDDIILV
jgi:ribonuclease BN (tRNA processing enzyme)